MAAGHALPAAQRSTGEKWDWPVHWGHETVAIMSESRFREVYREACDRSGKALPLRKNTWRLIVFAAAVLILPREWGQNQSLERVARQEESCRFSTQIAEWLPWDGSLPAAAARRRARYVKQLVLMRDSVIPTAFSAL